MNEHEPIRNFASVVVHVETAYRRMMRPTSGEDYELSDVERKVRDEYLSMTNGDLFALRSFCWVLSDFRNNSNELLRVALKKECELGLCDLQFTDGKLVPIRDVISYLFP